MLGVGLGPVSVALRAGAGEGGATAPPGPPGAMAAPTLSEIAGTSMRVDFAAGVADGGAPVTRYDIRHGAPGAWTVVALADAPASHLLTGLTEATGYEVQTRAWNAVGPGDWSPSAFATTAAPATAPPQLGAPTIGEVTATTMEVTFAEILDDGGAPIIRYDLRFGAPNAWTSLWNVGGTVYLVTGLDPATAYQVQTRVRNEIGFSLWSPSAFATTA